MFNVDFIEEIETITRGNLSWRRVKSIMYEIICRFAINYALAKISGSIEPLYSRVTERASDVVLFECWRVVTKLE